MRHVWWRLAAAAAIIGTACAPVVADDLKDCRDLDDLSRKIAACSQIIGQFARTNGASKDTRGQSKNAGIPPTATGEQQKILVEAYVRRGYAFGKKSEHDRAILDLSEAIRLQPRNASAYRERGIVYRNKGDLDRSIADLTEAIRINPRFAVAYNSRGLTYRAKRDLDSALADFSEAIRIDPKAVAARNNRAWLYLGTHKYDLGLTDVDEALKINPKDAANRYGRARLLEALGRRDEALADYRKLLEQQSSDPADIQRQTIAKERIAKLTRPAPAPGSRAGRRVALVIGNSNYVNASDLPNPRNDAKSVATSLRRVGFTEVIELYDAKREAMGQALKRFGDSAASAEWAVVFFAGHGLELNGTTYVIPTDAELKRDSHVVDEAISLDLLTAKVDGASKLGLVILDACRNNPFIPRMTRSANIRSLGQGLANIEPEGDVLVAYSARHGTVADDGAGPNSPYTEALLAHIEEQGLEINFLFRKIRDDVLKKTNKRQDPIVYGALGSEPLYFASTR